MKIMPKDPSLPSVIKDKPEHHDTIEELLAGARMVLTSNNKMSADALGSNIRAHVSIVEQDKTVDVASATLKDLISATDKLNRRLMALEGKAVDQGILKRPGHLTLVKSSSNVSAASSGAEAVSPTQ